MRRAKKTRVDDEGCHMLMGSKEFKEGRERVNGKMKDERKNEEEEGLRKHE